MDLQEFFDSTAHLFKTPYGKSVLGAIQSSFIANRTSSEEKGRASSQQQGKIIHCLFLELDVFFLKRISVRIVSHFKFYQCLNPKD